MRFTPAEKSAAVEGGARAPSLIGRRNNHLNPRIGPAFPGCDSCIVLCADDNFMAITAVAVQSILERRDPAKQYDIIILHNGVSAGHIARYGGMFDGVDGFSVRFCDMGGAMGSGRLYTANRPQFSEVAYFRLMIPWVLGEDYHRALYLDGDMIACRDVAPLLQTELEGKMIAAVRDFWGICKCYIPGDGYRAYRESIGLPDVDDYVISATVLFDLDAIRRQYDPRQVLALCASRKWFQHDQDVLNVLFHRQIKLISPAWGFVRDYGENHFLPPALRRELAQVEAPAIYHFATVWKPYSHYDTPYDAAFWRLASHTAYFCDLLAQCHDTLLVWRIVGDLEKAGGPEESEALGQVRRDNLARTAVPACCARLERIIIRRNTLRLEGAVAVRRCDLTAPVKVWLALGGQRLTADRQYTENVTAGDGTAFRSEYFVFTRPLSAVPLPCAISFGAEAEGRTIPAAALSQGVFSPLTAEMHSSYYSAGGLAVRQRDAALALERCSPMRRAGYELAFQKELLATKGAAGKKAVILRTAARLLRRCMRKPLWLISDRAARADDNGKALFQYVNRHHARDVRSYFLIARESPDVAALKQVGRVVPLYSYRHKLLSLLADWSLASQVDEAFRHPFRDYRCCYADMLSEGRFAFLQHGVITPDKNVSTYVKRSVQQIDGFVVSTRQEWDMMVHGASHYDADQVWLTGLPRFDALEDRAEKIVTVMPTWRKALTLGQNHETGLWTTREDFRDSDYATFYRNLMQHPDLRAAAKRLGYTLQFKIHPSYPQDGSLFGFDSDTVVVPADVSYKDIYARSSLLVTDYSSGIFDFLYLRKPVIYCQSDVDTFYEGHVYQKGRVDYRHDGFGEVLYTLEDAAAAIIAYMENGCAMKPEYRQRSDAFFAFHDRDNCRRVVEKVLPPTKETSR